MAKPRKRRSGSRPASSRLVAAMGRAIQVVRTDRGWSRKDLAERAGLSYSFLCEIENGVKTPSSRTFAAIARALDVAPGALLYDAERRLVAIDAEAERETPAAQGRHSPESARAGRAASRTEGSHRVLDWLSGPLARRGRGDSTQTAASAWPAAGAGRTHRSARIDPDASPAAPEFAETANSAEGGTRFLDSLLPLLGGLSPEDRELVLDLARRLARGNGDS